MSNNSVAKNWIYNLILQIVNLLLPIITVPYISRVLGSNGVGINSFTLANTQYFILIGTLGIGMYGNRQIAYCRGNKEEISKTFWSIYFLNLFTTTISLLVYLFIFGRTGEYRGVYIIQSLNIVAAMIDITWLFMGLEDFKKTVTRNMIVKIVGVLCIFMFVKSKTDLNKYIFINSIVIVLGNLAMWMYVPTVINRARINISDIVKHFKPTIILFIPQIAIQVYAVLDKTMLGIFTNVNEVALYDQSQKIVKIALAIVTSLGVVMLPRMSNLFASGDNKTMNKYLNNTIVLVALISIPMTVGLAGISNEFMWFFGSEFKDVSKLMIILSPILFIISISNVIGMQYLIPCNRTKEFTCSVIAGGIVNVICNLILIPKYNAIGACIATVISELVVTCIQVFFVRKQLKKKYIFINLFRYFSMSFIMLIPVRLIGSKMGEHIVTTSIQGLVGIICYLIMLIIIKDENINRFVTKIKQRKK